MASPAKIYQSEIHRNLGFFATWLPGDAIAIGDIGVFEDGRFRRVSSLQSLHIPFDTEPGRSVRNLQYTSTKGTDVVVDAGASAQGVARGQINLEFSQNGSFVFQVHGLRDENLKDRHGVAAAIVDAHEHGRWEKEWLLVESLHSAEVATIIVSQDQSAALVLDATADSPISPVSLANPKVQLTVKSTRGKLVHVIGGLNTQPLYQCMRLKGGAFGRPKLQPVRGENSPDALAQLARPSLEELLGE